MSKTTWWLMLSVLLVAASASAQSRVKVVNSETASRKVWRDADLQRPLPRLARTPEPEAVAAMKRRSEYIPHGAGVFPSLVFLPAPEPPPLALPRWEEPPVQRYAEQPLWPVYLVLDQRVGPRRPLFCPRPLRLPPAPPQPVRWGIH